MVNDAPRILAGRYEVGELIGRGGMAEVHIGHDTRLGRTVAIKVLRSDLARDPAFQARFRREAQAAAALNHPAIVAVYDTGEEVWVDASGTTQHVPFIVMEYVEGHTVRDILQDGTAVPIEEAVEIVVGVLSALEYSHHAGIVHRDIKPANVMLTPTGAVKVMDFGIARAVADSGATMTQAQGVVGTAQYISPEQAKGEQVDARSDLYSTGCLLFELLTGRAPFQGDSTIAVVYQHSNVPPPVPSSLASDVPEVLDRITLKAMAKERAERYASAAEFRADLESAVRGGPVSAPPIGALGAAAVGAAAGAAAAGPGTAATQVLGGPQTAPTQAFTPGAGLPWEPTSPDAAEEEEEEPQRRWLLWTLIAVGALALIGIIALLLSGGPDEPETVTVPNLVGMTEAEVRDALEPLELEPRFQQEPSDEVDEGLVIRSDPEAGADAQPGDLIDVYLSAGAESTEVPNVEGEQQARAQEILRAADLVVAEVRTEDRPGFDSGEAIGTEPEAGEFVPRGSDVILYVASGNVDLPSLVGETQADAERILDDLDLNVRIRTEQTDDQEPGRVVRQDRSGLVPRGATIELVIAEEPEDTEVQVPTDIIGMTFNDAQSRLQEVGLFAREGNREHSDRAAGTVINARPEIGSVVEQGTSVELDISLGPEPTPTPTPTEEPGDEDD